MSVSFRDAREADLPAIVAMLADDVLGRTRDVASDTPDAAYAEAFRRIMENPFDTIVVGERDGRVVAAAQFTVLNGLSAMGQRRGLVESVRVASDVRGQGIGAALMEVLVERARAAGCGVVQLTSNASRTRARRFYERIGFAASHTGFKRTL